MWFKWPALLLLSFGFYLFLCGVDGGDNVCIYVCKSIYAERA